MNEEAARSSRFIGSMYATASAVLFGFAPLLMGMAYDSGMTAASVVVTRMVVSAMIAFAVCAKTRAFVPLDLRSLVLCVVAGVLYGFASLLSAAALQTVSPGLANTLFHLYPLFVLVLVNRSTGCWSMRQGVLAAIMFGGAALIFAGGSGWTYDGLGIALVLGAALSNALYTVLVGSQSLCMVPPALLTFVACAFSIPLSAVGGMVGGAPASFSSQAFFPMIALAILGTVVPLALYNEAAKKVGPALVALLSNFEPVATLIGESILVGKAPSLWGVAGCLIVVFAGTFLSVQDRGQK